jgi:hypothetical protein
MTNDLDNLPLPDALSPQRYDSHHGRPESYWTERNALVDAVKACPMPTGVRIWVGHDARTPEEQAQWEAYGRALDALKAFDAENGGAPIL